MVFVSYYVASGNFMYWMCLGMVGSSDYIEEFGNMTELYFVTVYFHLNRKQRITQTVYKVWDYNCKIRIKEKCRCPHAWRCHLQSNFTDDGCTVNSHKVLSLSLSLSLTHTHTHIIYLFSRISIIFLWLIIFLMPVLVSSRQRKMNGCWIRLQ